MSDESAREKAEKLIDILDEMDSDEVDLVKINGGVHDELNYHVEQEDEERVYRDKGVIHVGDIQVVDELGLYPDDMKVVERGEL